MKRLICTLAAAVIFALGLTGCIESPVQQDRYLIKGRVYGWDPIFVSIGDYPITATSFGYFQLDAYSKPYHLTISNSWSTRSMKLVNINYVNPQILTYDQMMLYFFFTYCGTYIKFPPIDENKWACAKFISSDVFIPDDLKLTAGLSKDSARLRVYLPFENNSIKGKVYYLQVIVGFSGIVSFERFGIKDVTLHKGSNPSINFTSEEIINITNQISQPVNINLPSGFEIELVNVCLSIPSLHKSSDMIIYDYRNHEGNIFRGSALIPIIPGNEFKIKIYCEYKNSVLNLSNYNPGKAWKLVNPGEPLELTISDNLQELLPQNGAQNITDTSTFEISDNEGNAVYEFQMLSQSPNELISLFTDKPRIKFSEFRTRAFELYSNSEYLWCARKIPGYRNIDEFLRQPYVIDERYDHVELSKGRSFKTGP